MIDNINLSDLFTSTSDDLYKVHKKNNGSIKKHINQDRFLALTQFINNSCYWSRFKSSVLSSGIINGKYLNQIHNEYCDFNIYDSVYRKIHKIYLEITNYESLTNLSIDSCFIRNILGKDAARNPAINNKPGYKVHVLVDSNRIPLSFCVTDCNIHDSVVVNRLINNIIIDKEIFSTYCSTFLADSAYSGFITIDIVTSFGLSVIMGRNKQHAKRNVVINRAYPHDLKHYKKRGIVENFFSNFQRIPCLINNYQRNIKSYEGLILLYCSSMLSKKINKLISYINDKNLKIRDEEIALEKKRLQKIKKHERYEYSEKKKEHLEKNNDQRKKETNVKLEILHDYIWSQCDQKKIKAIYDKKYEQYQENKNKTKKNRGRHKDTSYAKYEIYIKKDLSEHVRNNILTNTYKYTAGNKSLYFIKVDKQAFTLNNVVNKMKDINLTNKINEIARDFFA